MGVLRVPSSRFRPASGLAPGAAILSVIPVVAVLGALALLATCGSAASAMTPLPPRVTRATLAGPLCEGMEVQCQCRAPATEDAPTGGSAGEPEPGFKRYEIRLGPTEDELWATIGDMVFYKTRERGEECFYVDLRPGKHPVSLRAKAAQGFAARMTIAEQGARGWYDTFLFDCSTPNRCAMADLHDWDEAIRARKGEIHDPCGSTKIRDVRWQTGRLPDRLHPDELQLDLVLDIYRFTPEHGPGDAACAGE
jgi:hypothetical protein